MYFDERMINNYIEDNIYKNNTLLHITKRLSIKELVDNYICNDIEIVSNYEEEEDDIKEYTYMSFYIYNIL